MLSALQCSQICGICSWKDGCGIDNTAVIALQAMRKETQHLIVKELFVREEADDDDSKEACFLFDKHLNSGGVSDWKWKLQDGMHYTAFSTDPSSLAGKVFCQALNKDDSSAQLIINYSSYPYETRASPYLFELNVLTNQSSYMEIACGGQEVVATEEISLSSLEQENGGNREEFPILESPCWLSASQTMEDLPEYCRDMFEGYGCYDMKRRVVVPVTHTEDGATKDKTARSSTTKKFPTATTTSTEASWTTSSSSTASTAATATTSHMRPPSTQYDGTPQNGIMNKKEQDYPVGAAYQHGNEGNYAVRTEDGEDNATKMKDTASASTRNKYSTTSTLEVSSTSSSSSSTASTKTTATKSYMRPPLGQHDDIPNDSMNKEQEDYPAGAAYHHHGNENYAVRTEDEEEVMSFSPIMVLLVGLVVGLTCGLICCLSCICTWFCCFKKHIQEPCLVVPKQDDKSKASFDGVNYSMIPLKEESITR